MTSRLKHHAVTALICITMLYLSCIAAFAGSAVYTYDDLNRLTAIQDDDGTLIQYTYDEVGNRTTLTPTTQYPVTSTITSPSDEATVSGIYAVITGTASGYQSTAINKVEVSTDGGSSWHGASGKESWSYTWRLPADGAYNIRTRATDANEARDWRIYADLAQSLIATARSLYSTDTFLDDLKETVYALDATTIDLCLSMFPWADFRQNKGAVKLHALLDLRGNIPSFIHI